MKLVKKLTGVNPDTLDSGRIPYSNKTHRGRYMYVYTDNEDGVKFMLDGEPPIGEFNPSGWRKPYDPEPV